MLEKEYSLMINKLRDQDEESQKILSSLSLEYQELKVKCEKLQGLLQQKEQDAIKLNVERSALTKQLEALQIESRELKEGYEKNENALQLNLAECAKKIDKLQVGNQQKEKELASLTEEKVRVGLKYLYIHVHILVLF
ncbi:hypothetical protein EON65_09120 [archaeon]|nr:MAG: hypothetical protein EON65_09120 [archaeon]